MYQLAALLVLLAVLAFTNGQHMVMHGMDGQQMIGNTHPGIKAVKQVANVHTSTYYIPTTVQSNCRMVCSPVHLIPQYIPQVPLSAPASNSPIIPGSTTACRQPSCTPPVLAQSSRLPQMANGDVQSKNVMPDQEAPAQPLPQYRPSGVPHHPTQPPPQAAHDYEDNHVQPTSVMPEQQHEDFLRQQYPEMPRSHTTPQMEQPINQPPEVFVPTRARVHAHTRAETQPHAVYPMLSPSYPMAMICRPPGPGCVPPTPPHPCDLCKLLQRNQNSASPPFRFGR